MNTRVDTFSRPLAQGRSAQGDTSICLAAIACALAVSVVAALGLPSVLVLPAIAAALYVGAVGTMLATRRTASAMSEKGWLFAGTLFVAGVVASAASDLDAMLAYFR